eukprot:14633724-Alexandrium_andersonii.AAC.1
MALNAGSSDCLPTEAVHCRADSALEITTPLKLPRPPAVVDLRGGRLVKALERCTVVHHNVAWLPLDKSQEHHV